jgi:hypothetical protein
MNDNPRDAERQCAASCYAWLVKHRPIAPEDFYQSDRIMEALPDLGEAIFAAFVDGQPKDADGLPIWQQERRQNETPRDEAERLARDTNRAAIEAINCVARLLPAADWDRLFDAVVKALATRDAALREALKLLLADFYSPAEAEVWLTSDQSMLGGIAPAAAIAVGRAGDVIAIIAQLREGSYT